MYIYMSIKVGTKYYRVTFLFPPAKFTYKERKREISIFD